MQARVRAATLPELEAIGGEFVARVEAGMAEGAVAWATEGEPDSSGFPPNCYGMSKCLLIRYSQLLAAELGSGARVNAMCPGFVDTDMTRGQGSRTPAEGADTAVWLALLPADGPTAGMLRDREEVGWTAGPSVPLVTDSFTKTVMEEGAGPAPRKGETVTVSADLYLADDSTAIWSTHASSGFLFPSATPSPFSYQSGVGGVIRGWDDGVGSMKLGEKAQLDIPWEHAYGAAGHPGFKIGPKQSLKFVIKVLQIG
jgi:FK506-binding protein 1